MAQTLLFSDDYREHFDPKCYLNMFYQTPEVNEEERQKDIVCLSLRNHHEF